MNGGRGRRTRESSSPDRAKVCLQQQQQTKAVRPIRKVQVVYYLTRNGQLEHPHYMEVTHLVNQPLRLRDVMERLTALRGKGMPSLYSWSCKRSYKNGYVWNDLAVNDIIPPSDGAEYVLKGSELVDGCSSGQPTKSPSFGLNRNRGSQVVAYVEQEFDDDDDEEEEEEYELDEEKTCYTSSTTTPHSRCSRGVSTDELEYQEPPKPISKTPPPPQVIQKQTQIKDIEPIATVSSAAPGGRNSSVLLQLIACGNLAVNKAKNMPPPPPTTSTITVKQQQQNNVVKMSTTENLHRGAVCKSAVKKGIEDDGRMISCMSENPRFGNLQAEEKEYFSGSIVESMSSENRVETDHHHPVLKKSNSYNEERGCRAVVGVSVTVEEEKEEKAVKGNCIPRKKLPKQTRKMRVD